MSLSRLLVGLVILFLGIVFTLNNLGITNVSVGRLIGTYWPLILIAIGLLTLFSRRRVEEPSGRVESPIGNVDLGQRVWELRDTDIYSGLGDVRFDLFQARTPVGETRISVSQWMGSVKIFVPRALAVDAHGTVSVGSVNLLGQRSDGFFREASYTSPDYDRAESRVKINISVGMGDANIVGVG